MKSVGVCYWYVKIPQCMYTERRLEYITFYVKKKHKAPLAVCSNSPLVRDGPLGVLSFVRFAYCYIWHVWNTVNCSLHVPWWRWNGRSSVLYLQWDFLYCQDDIFGFGALVDPPNLFEHFLNLSQSASEVALKCMDKIEHYQTAIEQTRVPYVLCRKVDVMPNL